LVFSKVNVHLFPDFAPSSQCQLAVHKFLAYISLVSNFHQMKAGFANLVCNF
jgi:hypothetical protein